jgi:hypothetical protein
LIIIIPRGNAPFAIRCQAGIVTNVTKISVMSIFMMKITRNYAASDRITSILFLHVEEIILARALLNKSCTTFFKMYAGGGI